MIQTLFVICVVIPLLKLIIVISRNDIIARRSVNPNKCRMISQKNGLNVLILITWCTSIATKKCKARLIKFHVNWNYVIYAVIR